MPKMIEFLHDWFAEVEITAGQLKQVEYRKGSKMLAEVFPAGPDISTRIASANLRMTDGSTALRVPLSIFSQE